MTTAPSEGPFACIAGVVLAAGTSSRMGAFKPLRPLGRATVLETAIATLRDAGVDDVVVVTGHRGDELEAAIARAGARRAHNARYLQGMYTSVQAGVAALNPTARAFFLLPCDIPRPGVETVRALAAARQAAGDPDVVYPVHAGRRGHPPLISAQLTARILASVPDRGLRTLLREAGTTIEVVVAEPGTLRDLDTSEDYTRIQGS